MCNVFWCTRHVQRSGSTWSKSPSCRSGDCLFCPVIRAYRMEALFYQFCKVWVEGSSDLEFLYLLSFCLSILVAGEYGRKWMKSCSLIICIFLTTTTTKNRDWFSICLGSTSPISRNWASIWTRSQKIPSCSSRHGAWGISSSPLLATQNCEIYAVLFVFFPSLFDELWTVVSWKSYI